MIVEIEKTPKFTVTNIYPDHTTQEEWDDLCENLGRLLSEIIQEEKQKQESR